MARKAGWLYRSIELFLLYFGILYSLWHVGQDGYTEVLGFSCSASVFCTLYGTYGRMAIPKYRAILALLRYFALSMAHMAGWLYRSIGLFLLCFGILHSSWHTWQDGYTEVLGFSCSASVNHLSCRNVSRKKWKYEHPLLILPYQSSIKPNGYFHISHPQTIYNKSYFT